MEDRDSPLIISTLLQGELAKPEFGGRSPEFNHYPMVRVEIPDERLRRAVHDYLAREVDPVVVVPPGERPLDKGIYLIDRHAHDIEAQLSRSRPELQSYLRYHLLGQKLGRELAEKTGYSHWENIKDHPKPEYLLAEVPGGGFDTLNIENGPVAECVCMILEGILKEKGLRPADRKIEQYYETSDCDAGKNLPRNQRPHLVLTEKALLTLNAMSDEEFHDAFERGYEKHGHLMQESVRGRSR